jgi:hypothetical protein
MDASLTQPCRVQEDGPMGCKLLLYGINRRVVTWFASTVRISIG